LLQSNDKAANDPENELVYLYEIRDALSTNFGDDRKARTVLSITKSQWSRFGNLCNNEPLRQGRHRGEALGMLRDATAAELKEARDIAGAMIKAYLDYLEKPPGQTRR